MKLFVAAFVIMFLELGTFAKLLWDSVVYSQVSVYFSFVLFEGLGFLKIKNNTFVKQKGIVLYR